MNTKINLTYNGQDYTLEYDRTSVKMLENSGFVLDEFLQKPMNNIELAFAGSFIKNHKSVKQTVIDNIYKGCKNKNKLIETLTVMIQEKYESLLEDGDDEGNVNWEVIDLSPKTSQK